MIYLLAIPLLYAIIWSAAWVGCSMNTDYDTPPA